LGRLVWILVVCFSVAVFFFFFFGLYIFIADIFPREGIIYKEEERALQKEQG